MLAPFETHSAFCAARTIRAVFNPDYAWSWQKALYGRDGKAGSIANGRYIGKLGRLGNRGAPNPAVVSAKR